MTKSTFMSILKKKLERLPKEELYNITNYYEEYFQDSDKSEDEVIAELGSPSIIASEILSDYAISDRGNDLSLPNKILMAILAILAAPIGIPLIIVGITILFSIGVCIFSFLIAISAAILAIIFSGFACFVTAFAVILISPAISCFYIGSGLVITGISMLLVLGIAYIFPKVSLFLKSLISKVISMINLYRKRG